MRGVLSRNANILGLLLAYVLLAAVMSAGTSMSFLRTRNLLDITQLSSIVFLVASGMTCVIIMGEIDLGVGALISASSCVYGYLVTVAGWGMWTAALPVLCLGAFNAAVIAFLRTRFRIPSFITSLAFLSIWSGIAYLITNGMPFYDFPDEFESLGYGKLFGIPSVVIMAVVVFTLIGYMLNYTTLGRYIYAIGSNEKSAMLSGVPVPWVRFLALLLLGLLAAFVGIIQSSRLMSTPPTVGEGWEMIVIASVIVGGAKLSGGAGLLLGTVLGALFIETLENGLILMGVNPFTQLVMRGLVIVVAIWINAMRSHGVLGVIRAGEPQ